MKTMGIPVVVPVVPMAAQHVSLPLYYHHYRPEHPLNCSSQLRAAAAAAEA